MSYRLEGKDIVLSGFEEGIADSPYKGIGDMRNVEILSNPTEVSVQSKLTAATVPPTYNAVAFTATAASDLITVATTAGMYNGCAIYLNTNTATGLSINTVYYVQNLTSTTFTLSVAPAVTTAINITANGAGTLTTYTYTGAGSPTSYWIDRNSTLGLNATLLVDGAGKVWAIFSGASGSIAINTLYYLGNTPGGFPQVSGVCTWNGYLLLFGISGIDIANANGVVFGTGPVAQWDYTWQSPNVTSVGTQIPRIVSFEDGNLYWLMSSGVGSLIETPGDSFDPTDPATYSITTADPAIKTPESDTPTCIAELGSTLLIGGKQQFIYVWDKVSPGFTSLLNMPDNFARFIVATNQNAYVFAGYRGKIYITNGSGIELYKKVPDYVVGGMTPFIRFRDASLGKNQLYFSCTATQNDNSTTLNTVSGAWAIDLETGALRMINKSTNADYDQIINMVAERPPSGSESTGLVGTAMQLGWNISGSSTDVGVDLSTSAAPYDNYETYIDHDMIPVGTYLDPFTPSQIEWKTSVPIVSGEGVKIMYRTNITESFTEIGETTTAGVLSDMYQANFQKVQWVQLRTYLKSTSSNPSYVRLTEVRIRDFPSGKNSNVAYNNK